MRFTVRTSLALAVALLLATPTFTHAIAITGYGPGGFEDDNGADNLVLWFRSDKGLFQDTAGATPAVLNGDPVARWNDQSGYNRHMTTFVVNPRPATLVLNQVNSTQSVVRVDNDGGGGFPSSLRTPNFTLNQPEQVWSTHAFRGGDAVNPTVWDGSGGNTMRLYGLGGAGSTSFQMYAGGGVNGGAEPLNAFRNLANLYNGAGSLYRANGNLVGSGNPGGNGAGGFSIGGGVWGSGQGADADFSEIFVFNRVLNATEQIIVDNYQSAHSGIAFAGAVAANDHYAGDAPGIDYDFGVFGIGDDGTFEVDNAGMEGFGVQVPNGSLTGSPSSQWVFAGHDNGPNGITTPTTPFGSQRWQRSWFLDTTNIGSADLAFDWNDAGVTPYDAGFTTLLYSPTLGGPFSILATGGIVNVGNQSVEFLNVTLNDGYYTLGTIGVPEPSTFALLGVGLVGIAVRARRRRQAAA